MPIYKYYTAQGCLAQGFTVAEQIEQAMEKKLFKHHIMIYEQIRFKEIFLRQPMATHS